MIACVGTALPPELATRRGLPRRKLVYFGLGFALVRTVALDFRSKGVAQSVRGYLYGGAKPPPHIGRQSRNHPTEYAFEAKPCRSLNQLNQLNQGIIDSMNQRINQMRFAAPNPPAS